MFDNDLFPKFIIEGENLIIGKCKYHKHLATNVKNVKGGGWFRYDAKNKSYTLYGTSHDFGSADLRDIKDCIKKGNVYGRSLVVKMNRFKFFYDTQSEIIPIN